MTGLRSSIVVAVVVLTAIAACSPGTTRRHHRRRRRRPTPQAPPTTARARDTGSLVIVGRIVTMDDPPVAEALLIEDGTVTAVGTRDEVLALAGDEVPVMDIGENVAYPDSSMPTPTGSATASTTTSASPAEAMDAALTRGWTSISEQWVNPERLDELEGLAADDALPLRVDAYLALNFGTIPRRLVRRPRARAGGRPPARPGTEDPSRQRRGHRHQLGARPT